MDYSAITDAASWTNVTTAVLLIFGALAALHATVTGCLLLIDALNGNDDDDTTDLEDDERDP